MICEIEINDNLVIRDKSNPSRILRLDMSSFYCRLFETTHAQSRDYLEEIIRWAGTDEVENYDYLSSNLMHCTAAQRRQYGLKK